MSHPRVARLPFTFQASGGIGRLALSELPVGLVIVDRLELEVTDLGTDPGVIPAERFQRRRTRLRGLAVRMTTAALEERVAQVRKQLQTIGLGQLQAKIGDGFISVRARAADGLAAADLSFRIQFVNAGAHLRALATTVRVHGHLPTPGPIIADRVLTALFGATESAGVPERPRTRGLCDVELDLVGALLWHLMPPAGWRLPAVAGVELTSIRIDRAGIEITYGPVGTRTAELGVRPQMQAFAAAHDLMHSVDQQLRDGHLEEAMRGYRALLASNGPDQPLLLERILALASARPAWFFDGLELSRQALGRWPDFQAAHAALASITLAQGDAREAASHLTQVAQHASAEGDDDQAALAALAGARLLRVLEPKAATQLYQLALEHDPGSAEAADSLADRLADEQRWSELVRLVRARAASTTDPARVVQLRLRLADVFMHHLDDAEGAQQELAAARALAPEDPSILEMTATILATREPAAAVEAWREVARLAEARGDARMCGRAWATLGGLLASGAPNDTVGITAEIAWERALEYDALQIDALAGLAHSAAKKDEHGEAVRYYERLRGLGLAQHVLARYELEHARSLVALTRIDEARASLRRATLAGGETAAEAHAVLAEIAEASADREHAAAELDTAIDSFVELASTRQATAAHASASQDAGHDEDRFYTRAAELAILRATLFDRSGQASLASQDWQRAHALATDHAPQLARDAAKTLLARAGDDAHVERRWIDAVLATRPPPHERAALLVRRADVRRRERTPDLAAALADLHEAVQLTEDADAVAHPDEQVVATRRRAYQLEAELLAQSGDQRARAQALASLARMAERAQERVEVETAAAAAWLAADEPASALPHGARAAASLESQGDSGPVTVPAALRREVLVTFGEAAWRQRAWADVIRAYTGLIADPGSESPRVGTYRYRLAVAADRTGDAPLAIATLKPLVDSAGHLGTGDVALGLPPDLRAQALRLYADLSERAGELGGAAHALESFASLADAAGAREGDARKTTETSASARADAMYRAGELFRRAGAEEDAIRCLEAALRISDSHLPALDALEAMWRERGDLERVAVILGRKVAATARHPARQKPLLSRLGDLQAQLGRPEVALATHQRALEIDPTWRPSLRFVTQRLHEQGQHVAAAGGFAQLAGELAGDSGDNLADVVRDRQSAAVALAALVMTLSDGELEAVRDVALPALERRQRDDTSWLDAPLDMAPAIARLKGEASRAQSAPAHDEREHEHTPRGRMSQPSIAALSLRDAAERARADGKLADAFATLETANHVNPGDITLLRELVELAQQLGDHAAAAKHLADLATRLTGAHRANTLLELADVYFDQLDDPPRGREAMRNAADAFGTGARRDSTLRLLATEASTNLAWDVAVEALAAIVPEKRSATDLAMLANAYVRAGRDGEAVAVIEEATTAGRFDDGGKLLDGLRADIERKAWLARTLEARAGAAASPDDAAQMRAEAKGLRDSVGEFETLTPTPRTKTDRGVGSVEKTPAPLDEVARIHEAAAEPTDQTAERRERTPTEPPPTRQAPRAVTANAVARIKLVQTRASQSDAIPEDDDAGFQSVTDPKVKSGPVVVDDEASVPSVVITGSESEKQQAVVAAAASADRDRLVAAHREHPDDAGVLLALLANITATAGDDAPAQTRAVLEEAARTARGRALAIALHELASLARRSGEATRAAALWARAHEIDPAYEPVWMPLADAHAAADEIEAARELYEKIAGSSAYDAPRRQLARERADAFGAASTRDVVSGEISWRDRSDLATARQLAEAGDLKAAAEAAQRAAERAAPDDHAALELLESLYLELGDITAASEAIGRQLVTAEDPVKKATLWRRRAKIYRSAIGRDAEAYRCLKEAHACNPADPEISYLLRTAAMVRDEWALAASLLYREIAAATHPRERGALHLELALIYLERLDDPSQAQVNFEQALAFDPTIPAAKPPLAKRYEAIGRLADAAKLYEEAAKEARPADRATLLASAQRARNAVTTGGAPDLAVEIERAEASGDLDNAVRLAHELWGREPGNARAFRVLANVHRAAGDLEAMTALTTTRAAHTSNASDRASVWLDVARLAEEVGQLDQAARAYDLALAEDPLHVGALDARGALAFRLGDYTAADLIYKDIAPGESVLGADELALRRSIIAEKLGRDTEALDHAQVAQAASPARRDIVMRVQELATRMGELDLAIVAARKALELIPLDDEEAQLATHFQLVDLLRQCGKIEAAIAQLERVRRDHPMNSAALEMLAELHTVRGDWVAATRYLYQLVPLAPTPALRADRLYRLGEAVLVHLGDVDRADDVFLRASDLDPNHLPTLRRLIDVYWRADDPGALVEVASELVARDALVKGVADGSTLAYALVAAALLGETTLAERLGAALGDEAPKRIASALAELANRDPAGRLKLQSASTAIAELGRRGLLDLQKVRAHAAGTPVEPVLV